MNSREINHNGTKGTKKSGVLCVLCVGVVIFSAGCRQDMHDQPRYKPLGASSFFADGRASRLQVEGTVARGQLREDELYYTGRTGNDPAAVLPFPATREVLERGHERYGIYCTPCHGLLGDGEGMIVQRGFRHPPSFHIDRLREAPVGYYFDVMTKGFGAMASYASRIPPADRWAIAAYVRALQLSQNAKLADAPASEQKRLMEGAR